MTAAAAVVVAGAMLTACGGSSSDGGSGGGGGIVTANGSEPQNPLVPTNTNENGGGRIVDRLFAGLTSYDDKGVPSNEVAESIDTSDNVNYDIKIKPDWTFSDGTAVTSKSFVDAWNYGALGTNAQLQQSFFEPILGYDEVSTETPTAQTMSGLKVVSDTEFTVQLKQPTIDFELRLGFTPFYPLPEAAFADMKAFGENPIGNGPYKFASEGAWQHNVRLDLVPNETYKGNRVPKNSGLGIVFYSSFDTAYADLQSDNLDVLDTIPPSALPTYESDLGDRALKTPTAQNQTITIPARLQHFSGEEGNLRRQAISMAINRDQITQQIFQGVRQPLKDFTATTLPGHSDSIPGSEVLDYNPDQAKALWAQADAISPWTGSFQVAYNADGGHQEWIDAAMNSVRNTLGIEAVGAPQPTFAQVRTQITDRTIQTAFRTGWQGDYPSLLEFLEPIFVTGAGSNDGDYSNPAFDAALRDAEAAPDAQTSYDLTNKAQEILLKELPAIPMWDYINAAGYSTLVGDVAITWNGLPDYENVTKG